MTELFLIVGVFAGGVALSIFTIWIERAVDRPGLAHLISAVTMLGGAGCALFSGHRLLPVIFAVQAGLFLGVAYTRHRAARRKDLFPRM